MQKVSDGIRNLEAVSYIAPLSPQAPLVLLTNSIERTMRTAASLKALPATLDKSAHHNTITIEPCPTWFDASTTLKNFADKVDDFKITKVTDSGVEFVGQGVDKNIPYQWVISAQQLPQQSGSYPSHAFDDQFVINTQLRQFDKKRNKFVTVRHGQMPVQHDVGFQSFVSEMCNTFEPTQNFFQDAPDGAAAALAEIKTGPGGQQQQPIVGTPMQPVKEIIQVAEIVPVAIAVSEQAIIEAIVEEVALVPEDGVIVAPQSEAAKTSQVSQRKPDIAWVFPEAAESTISKFMVWKRELEECFMTRKKNASPELLEEYCYEQDLAGLTDEQKAAIKADRREIEEQVLNFTSAEKGTIQEIEEFVDGWMFEEKEPMENGEGISSTMFDRGIQHEIVRSYRFPSLKKDAFQAGNRVANLEESTYKFSPGIESNSGKGQNRKLVEKKALHIVVED